MRIAALVKQIPRFETMALGADGRLERAGIPLELNAYCRRAVSKAVELTAADGEVVVFTLGPASADDVLREAIAWGDRHGSGRIRGVHLCDPAFAGSDTLATAKALAAGLEREGRFDLVLCGRNSIDADTGQVGPQLAELLGLPFVGAARQLVVDGHTARARAELDDGWMQIEARLPAVIACAERLIEPSKVEPEGRAAVAADRIARRRAAEVGAGPWGAAASPTSVGETRSVAVDRIGHRRADLDLDRQIDAAFDVLRSNPIEMTSDRPPIDTMALRSPGLRVGAPIVVWCEPGRRSSSAELLGAADRLAIATGSEVVALAPNDAANRSLGELGADRVVVFDGEPIERAIALASSDWIARHGATIGLAPSTAWGREVAARVAVRCDAGLTGDAVDLEIDDGRLVAWKPAFGGAVVAAIRASSRLQLVTVRPGVFARPPTRDGGAPTEMRTLTDDGSVRVLTRERDDDLDELATARRVIGVGRGVDPERYADLEPLRSRLGAEYAATRKVTDAGWMPRARQLGITGRSIRPELFVSIGAHGKYNHAVGYRGAKRVIAINQDATAPVFDTADVGIVADWPAAVARLAARSAELQACLVGR